MSIHVLDEANRCLHCKAPQCHDVHPVKETMKKHKIFCDRQHSCRSFFMQREKGHVSQKE